MKFIFPILIMVLYSQYSTAQEWQLVGFEDYEIEHVYAKGDTIWVCTRDSTYRREVFYSFSRGDAWNKVDDSDSLINGWLKLIKVTPNNNLSIYATAGNGRGLKSTDGGQSWNILFPDLEPWPGTNTRLTDIFISSHNPQLVFGIINTQGSALSVDYLFRSFNLGKDWENLNTGFPVSSHGSTFTIALDPLNSLKMYAAVSDEYGSWYFYNSDNNGLNWNYQSQLLILPKRIIVDPIFTNRIYVFATPFRTENGGLNWVQADSGIAPGWQYWASTIDPKNHNILYMSTKYGIYKTIDNAKLWNLMNESKNLDLNFSSSLQGENENLFIDSTNNILYVGTKKGLYTHNLITSTDEDFNNPREFELFQNYPNPFNNSTVISYQLTHKEHVTVKIFDISGREIKTLIDHDQNAGAHSITFDAGSLSSGIYIYKITTLSGFSRSRKMILIK